jgi:hypothetical protein
MTFTGYSVGIWVATGKMILHDAITVFSCGFPLENFS